MRENPGKPWAGTSSGVAAGTSSLGVAAGVAALALFVRLALVAWAVGKFPAAGDGTYYDILAGRLADGQGYTWLWPDGVVTFAAHYPVGYPALLAPFYALFGKRLGVAMVVNAVVGTVGVAALTDVLARTTSRRRAWLGGILVALHPALLAYTPALMTEVPTLSLLLVALAAVDRSRRGQSPRVAGGVAGVAVGLATLMRPQSLVFAPLLGALTVASGQTWRQTLARRGAAALTVTLLTLGLCLPWTIRNCQRMQSCALVSVNGGWNLLIGVQSSTGAFVPLDVPPPCREVWSEAGKDACFGRVAKEAIVADPVGFLRRMPSKWAVTLDYFGAAPWYLHASNSEAFPYRAKEVLGTLETVFARLALVVALVAGAQTAGQRRRLRMVLAGVGVLFACQVHGYPAYALLAVQVLLLGVEELGQASPLLPFTAATILATFAVHGVFFGAGRYGLMVAPFVIAMAVNAWPKVSHRASRDVSVEMTR